MVEWSELSYCRRDSGFINSVGTMEAYKRPRSRVYKIPRKILPVLSIIIIRLNSSVRIDL